MRHIGKVVAYLILAVNSFFAGMLLLTAYSPHIHPADQPLLYDILVDRTLQICFVTVVGIRILLSANTHLSARQLHH